jgi:hypothetical protein
MMDREKQETFDVTEFTSVARNEADGKMGYRSLSD